MRAENRGQGTGDRGRKRAAVVALGVLLSVCLIAALSAGARNPTDQTQSSEGGRRAAQINSTGWREAVPGYEFMFPRDHASHPDYRIEWWYYTGNLEAADGRRFGYQLTFFRTGVVPIPAIRSRWAVRDLFMAHFAVSDIEREKFYWFERINRAGPGWAGAETDGFRVWNEDWQTQFDGSDHLLEASDEGVQLELRLTPEKREIIHGDKGVSQRGPLPENASHYYSITRFRASGRVMIEDQSFDVVGTSWMDHEFGTSLFESGQAGWDWFSIQLDDGRELMLLEIRRRDGSLDPRSSGTIIDADGRVTHIAFGEFELVPGAKWKSEASGAEYPVEWKVALPKFNMDLNVRAAINNQELITRESTGVTYWEGSIIVDGSSEQGAARGRGYLEMTGYSGGAVFR